MSITTLTSREFNHDASKAKRAARGGPVIITERGRPSHVLITIEEYEKLSQGGKSIVEQLACDEATDIELDLPQLDSLAHEADLN